MKIERFFPGEILKPFIKSFLVIESDHGMVNRLLPDTSLVMAFRFKGMIDFKEGNSAGTLPRSVITGLRKTPRWVTYSRYTATLLVMFRETGAAAFFKEPLNKLYEHSLPLDHFFDRQMLADTEDQLSDAGNHLQRIAIAERFLTANLRATQTDLLTAKAIEMIQRSGGMLRIRELAAGLYISQDAFEKRFRRNTGATPKQFASIVRLRKLVDDFPAQEDLTGMAYAAGYFDQAHFIKDFRMFTGQTPGDFLRTPPKW